MVGRRSARAAPGRRFDRRPADLHIGGFRPFLVFNVADAAITIGVLIVLARSLFMREKPAEPQSPDNPDEPAPDAAETH